MRSVIAFAALLALSACDRQSPSAPQASDAANAGGDAGGGSGAARPRAGALDESHRGDPMPDLTLAAGNGKTVALRAARTTPVIVNLWASWCGPCVRELPSLARLAKRHSGTLTVLPISQDMGSETEVFTWWNGQKLAPLATLLDPDGKATAAYGAVSLPMTIVYDAQGREVWRVIGDIEWDGPAAAKALALAGIGGGGGAGGTINADSPPSKPGRQ